MQKILLVLGVVCLQGAFVAAFTEADLRPSHKECLKELNLDADIFLSGFADDWTVTIGNKDMNNIALCAIRKEHMLKDDDTLDADKYKEMLVTEFFPKLKLTLDNPNEIAANAVDACKSIQGSDVADTFLKHHNCIINFFKTFQNTLEA